MKNEEVKSFSILPAERDTSLVRVFVGGLIGLPVGWALGFYVFVFIGKLNSGHEFAQVGWLYALAGTACGAIAGVLLGAFTFNSRPRLFLMTFLPLAILLAAQQVTLRTLRSMDRPRQYLLQIVGTPGADFAGRVLVQGKAHELRGEIPARFTYDGLQLRCAFGLLEPKNNAELGVEVYADGHKVPLGSLVNTGVRVEVYSRGYAENIARTSGGWSRLTRLDVEKMLRDREIPARGSSPEPGDF